MRGKTRKRFWENPKLISGKKTNQKPWINFPNEIKEKRNVLFSGSVVKSKTGRAIGLACIIHDITELKNIEERLVKAERLASIGELAGQIGHDLRNPLSGIKNSVYLLKKNSNRLTELDRNKILETMNIAVEDSDRIVTSRRVFKWTYFGAWAMHS